MQPFKFALPSFLASALAVCAVRNITIDDFDPRIVYTHYSAWTRQMNTGTSDRLFRTTSFTTEPASASIEFNGTAVYFISYGRVLPEPTEFQVTIDGQTETASLRVNSGSERPRFMAYSRTGLDPSTGHQITISNPFGAGLNIDGFIFTVPDNSTDSEGGAQSPEQTRSQSNGDSGLTAAAKAGIAVGSIFLGLLAAVGVYYWQKNKKKSNAAGDSAKDKEGGDSGAKPHNPQNTSWAEVDEILNTVQTGTPGKNPAK